MGCKYYRVTGISLFFSNLISWVLVDYLSWIQIAQNFLDKWTFDNLLVKSWIFEETNNGNKSSFRRPTLLASPTPISGI